ncbi:MAG: rhomboid family intramembrane serine protease [Myxococcota bacterium]
MVQRLLIANVVVFIAQFFLDQRDMLAGTLGVSAHGVFQTGQIWQPFTYMWAHVGFWHIASNMLGLWWFGPQLEQTWGSRRFLRFYLLCGVGAGFIILGWNTLVGGAYTVTLGASGAVFGILTAFSLMWPDQTISLIFPPISFRAIWFIPILFLMQLMMSGGGNISHIGHLGGVAVAGFILRDELRRVIGFSSLRFRWSRWRMRGKLRAVRREEFERRRPRHDDDDDDRPTLH